MGSRIQHRSRSAIALAIIAMVLGIGPRAHAANVYVTGFESPTYTTGSINGQDGWTPISFGVADVQTGVVASGSQAVHFNPETAYSHDASSPTANQIVTLEFDAQYGGISQQADITLYGDAGYLVNAQMNNSSFSFTNGSLNSVVTSGASANTWHHMKAVLDFQAATITGYANGNLVGSLSMPNAGTTTTLANFVANNHFANGVQSYFDNVSITTTTVPEPATAGTLTLLGLGAATMRRRKH